MTHPFDTPLGVICLRRAERFIGAHDWWGLACHIHELEIKAAELNLELWEHRNRSFWQRLVAVVRPVKHGPVP